MLVLKMAMIFFFKLSEKNVRLLLLNKVYISNTNPS